jgi:glycosyltransferase involved in cell wall biosynthesis
VALKPPSAPLLGIDASRVSADRAGIDNYLHHLLPGLVAAWRKGGGDVVVFAADPAVASHVDPPVTVVPGGGRGWTQARLPLEVRRLGVSVYFSPIPVLPVLVPLSCPAVVTVHDLLEFRTRWWYFRRLIGRTLDQARAVICVSQATLEEVRAEFPRGAAKAVVVREAADAVLYREAAGGEPDPVFKRLGVPGPPILAVGTLQPRKNYLRLVEAYARVASEEPALAPLVIVGGRGWEYEPILARPQELGVADRVIFTGHLDEPDLAALMRHAVMLAAVSTAEGFGLPLVEAMYSGIPILASDIPPFREVAGHAATFVNPGSVDDIAAGLRRLATDAALRQQLVEVGRGRRALFSWDRAAGEVGEVLRATLTGV